MAKETTHPGFYIPNAADVSNPRMAEPDRVDFSTLAHPLWGVIEGCAVTISGSNYTTSGGTLLINGVLVKMSASTAGVGVAGAQDRFDLVVADAGGLLNVISGTQAVDPVFPDPPLNTTVLAATFCPAGATTVVDNVIDKRKFVNRALLTKISPASDLIRNLNGTGDHFRIDGGGTVTWENDATMRRTAPFEITLDRNLVVSGGANVGENLIVGGQVKAADTVGGSNLQYSEDAPASPMPGMLWQSADGRLYIQRGGAWQEMATFDSANPPGTVITSLEIPAVMIGHGWIPMDGRTIFESDFPTLFTVQGMTRFIRTTSTGRVMDLPDARKVMLMTDFDTLSGTVVRPNSDNKVTLKADNLPRHGHNPRTQPAGRATPRVSVTPNGNHSHVVSGGEHPHDLNDPAHRHHGMDLGNGIASAVIALMWNGQNKIDALFNDRNHTYSVERMEWSMPAVTNIQILSSGSGHGHIVDPNGQHDHVVTIDAISDHAHDMTEDLVGNGVPFDITPDHMAVYTYVRS